MQTAQELEHAIRAEQTAVFIVNTWSRQGERLFFRAMDALIARGITIVASYAVRDPKRMPDIVREAVRQQHRLIIVGGGDGTISSLVDEFAYRDVVLGLLPLGTENSFARTLNIPLTLQGAIEVILAGKVADVDLGKVGEDYFANIADIGLSAEAVRTTTHSLKRYLGKLAYVWVGAKVLLQHRAFDCHIRTDNQDFTLHTHEVIIANGRFFGDTMLAANASVSNRKLFVCTMETLNRWQLTNLWIALLRGKHSEYYEIHCFSAEHLWVETDPPQYINIDGEATTQTPAHFSVAPQALKVLVPQMYREA